MTTQEKELKAEIEKRMREKRAFGDREERYHGHGHHYYDKYSAHERKHEHLEDRHYHDLFDFDDPMSDSDYDDLDEYTGIYHDEDPVYHPSHHVKRHYTEE